MDAQTGRLLWRKNITQDQQTPYTYNIYNNDSPTPSAPVRSVAHFAHNTTATEPQPPGISRTDLTLISEVAVQQPRLDSRQRRPERADDRQQRRRRFGHSRPKRH